MANPALLVEIERVLEAPVIDADLSDWQTRRWQSLAATTPEQGIPGRIYLRNDGPNEPPFTAQTNRDLSAQFSLAWSTEGIYLAARITDNVHDIDGRLNWQWFYKDAVCLFLDLALDGDGSGWLNGDHCFAFVADPGANAATNCWWRRGTPEGHRESSPFTQVQRAVRLDSQGYVVEAFIPMHLLAQTAPTWRPPYVGRTVGFMFIVTDPDGGLEAFGGQMMYGGSSDNDALWAKLRFREAGQSAAPLMLDDAVGVHSRPLPVSAEERRFKEQVQADRAKLLPLLVSGSTATRRQLSQPYQHLGDKYFRIYLEKRPSKLAAQALGVAFTLWGEGACVEEIRQALTQISPQEDVWHLVLPGLRQAFYLRDEAATGLQLIAQLASDVVPLKSRSALLLPLANNWLNAGQRERARDAFEQIVQWRASLWHIEEALRGLNRLTAPAEGF